MQELDKNTENKQRLSTSTELDSERLSCRSQRFTAIASSFLLTIASIGRQDQEPLPKQETSPVQKEDQPKDELTAEQKRILEALRTEREAVEDQTNKVVAEVSESQQKAAHEQAVKAINEANDYAHRINTAFQNGFHASARELSLDINTRVLMYGENVECSPDDILCEILVQGAVNACWELGENPTPFAQKLVKTLRKELGPTAGESIGPALRKVLEADPDLPGKEVLRRFGADVVKYGKKALKGKLIEIALGEVSGLARGIYCSKDEITWFAIERYAIAMTGLNLGPATLQTETYEDAVKMWDEYDAMKLQHWEDFKTSLAECWNPKKATPLQGYMEIIIEDADVAKDQLERHRPGYERALHGAPSPSTLRPSGPAGSPAPADDGPPREVRPILPKN